MKAAIDQVADPLELIRRVPAPGELITDPAGKHRQQLDQRPEGLHRIVERHRLLEDRRRRPGAERAGVLAPRELLQARPFTAEALEERRGGQGGQLAQGANAPAVEPRRHLGGEIEERHRSRRQIRRISLGLDDGDAIAQPAGEARADPAARDAHPDLLPALARRRHEPPGEPLLAAKEPTEPGGVEIHVIGPAFLHPWGVGERDLEQIARGG